MVIDQQLIVEQQITDLLVTNRYERLMLPDYGCHVSDMLFTPIIQQSLNIKASEIAQLLASEVQLAIIHGVTIMPIPGKDSTVNLNVQYSIKPASEVFTVSRTVSGLVTEETIA